MSGAPVLAALLESDEGLLMLDHELLSPREAVELGYGNESLNSREHYTDYRDRRFETSTADDLFDYHTLVKEFIDEPIFLYDEGLLRDEVYDQALENIYFFNNNLGRDPKRSEVEAMINSAMDNDEFFPRKAFDKEEFMDRLYVGLYESIADTPPSAVSGRKEGKA